MKALVTGATGFIGSHLVDLLLIHKYDVRVLLRRTSSTVWLKDLPIEFVYGDLFDPVALRNAVEGVHSIYHSAGLTKAKTKHEYIRGNVTGTVNLLDAVRERNRLLRRFVLISSQAAAGPSRGAIPVTEADEPHPITTYGRSKLQAELECLKRANEIPITILRPPVVYGPRDKDVYEFFRTLARGLQPMVGLRDKYVSMIHVSDLVRGFVMAGECEKAIGETYFLSSKDFYSWKQLGDIARQVLGRSALRLRIPEFAAYGVSAVAEFLALFSSKPALLNLEKARDMVQDYWTCDASKAELDFGFRQQVSLEEGMRSAVEWYRKQGWL